MCVRRERESVCEGGSVFVSGGDRECVRGRYNC